MSEMTHFEYAGFYDVPRHIKFRYKGRLLLLESWFDESLDEYPDNYSIYVVPKHIEPSLDGPSWGKINSSQMDLIGSIPIAKITFDSTKRKSLDASFLETLNIA